MRFRTVLLWFGLVASASAGIVDDVRQTLAQNNFPAAESQLNAYRGQQGVTPESIMTRPPRTPSRPRLWWLTN